MRVNLDSSVSVCRAMLILIRMKTFGVDHAKNWSPRRPDPAGNFVFGVRRSSPARQDRDGLIQRAKVMSAGSAVVCRNRRLILYLYGFTRM